MLTKLGTPENYFFKSLKDFMFNANRNLIEKMGEKLFIIFIVPPVMI